MKCLLLLGVLVLAGCSSRPTAEKSPVSTAAASSAAPPGTMVWSQEWTPLLNGRDLSNWAITDFVASGKVTVKSNEVRMTSGAILTGINWTNGPLPHMDYEISLEALKSDGSDFFCGLTFPVGDSFCSLIMGGWGGSVTGLSSLDGMDASENDTSKSLFYELNRWYGVRVRVSRTKIEAWLDGAKIIDASTEDRKVSLRPGAIEFSEPLGVAAYETGAAVRDIKLRLTKS